MVDVTPVLTGDLPEFSARRRLRASGIDPRRTFIEKVKAFPTNIEAKVLMTYRPRGAGGRLWPGGPTLPIGGDSDQGGVTVMLHHSLIELPEKPMRPAPLRRPRRVSSPSRSRTTAARSRRWSGSSTSRDGGWRRRTPRPRSPSPRSRSSSTSAARCRRSTAPGSRRGSRPGSRRSRRPGSRTPSSARSRPPPQEDPDWDAEDARYSSIRWLPSTIENAYGPHVHDPRTGEILEADIRMYHNVVKLVRDWYFVQASPNDPKAQTLPLPDDLIGRAAGLRHDARGRPLAGLPAQHEGQLGLHRSSSSATRNSPASTASRRRSWTTAGSTTSPSPATAPG